MTNSNLLPHEIIETNANPNASIIWLHGLGADGHDFEPVVPMLKLPSDLKIRFIFPHAPMRPVTINGGFRMRAWYDIKSQVIDKRGEEKKELEQSQKQIMAFIEDQMHRGISSERIILGGFSQGGAITYHTGLRCAYPLGGLFALSTYNPMPGLLGKSYPEHTKNCPVLIAHGEQDPIIPFSLGQRSRTELEDLGYLIEFYEYPMGHSLCDEEIRDVSVFIQKVLRK